ncbi:MAG: hypothetical protein DBY41_07250 [Clostridium sp.]|nr:MAG: hypothetical protein DBY41_07250 [Clostridium sp.]
MFYQKKIKRLKIIRLITKGTLFMFLFFVLFGGGKMSAFNRCIISGLIDSEPNFNPDGELIFSIIINRKDIPRKEKIHVTIKNKGLYKKAFKEIKKNNFFLSNKAHIETRDVDRVKEIVCPHCSNVTLQKIHGENTLVVIDDFSVYFKKDLETSPLEGINQVYLMGVVCSNLKYTKAANGKEFLKYKISLLNINNDKNEKKYNYPFAVCFGQELENAQKKLQKGDIVFIEGAVQERTFKQTTKDVMCSSCKTMFNHFNTNTAKEIIVSHAKYLKPDEKDFEYIEQKVEE